MGRPWWERLTATRRRSLPTHPPSQALGGHPRYAAAAHAGPRGLPLPGGVAYVAANPGRRGGLPLHQRCPASPRGGISSQVSGSFGRPRTLLQVCGRLGCGITPVGLEDDVWACPHPDGWYSRLRASRTLLHSMHGGVYEGERPPTRAPKRERLGVSVAVPFVLTTAITLLVVWTVASLMSLK